MRAALLFPALLLAATSACGPKLIPDTTIEDTPETRAVLDVLGRYKSAVEARDSGAVLAIVSPRYFDKNLDYGALQKELPKKLGIVKTDKLDLEVKDVHVKGDDASIDLFYTEHYLVALPAGDEWQQRSDDSRMSFRREDGNWKIVAGL